MVRESVRAVASAPGSSGDHEKAATPGGAKENEGVVQYRHLFLNPYVEATIEATSDAGLDGGYGGEAVHRGRSADDSDEDDEFGYGYGYVRRERAHTGPGMGAY